MVQAPLSDLSILSIENRTTYSLDKSIMFEKFVEKI